MKIFYQIYCLCFVFIMQACAPFAPAIRQPYSLPEQYAKSGLLEEVETKKEIPQVKDKSNQTDQLYALWWTSFESAELNELVQRAIGANFDILSARARLMQLEALTRKSKADLFPTLNANMGGDNSRSSEKDDNNSKRTEDISENVFFGLEFSYELDLWGRIYSLSEADLLHALAGQEDVHAAILTVTALTSDIWLSLVAKKAEIRLVQSQIETNQIVLNSLIRRFHNALSTGLDIFQQQETLAASHAELPLLKAQENRLSTQLAIILGQVPGTQSEIKTLELPELPSLAKIGIPIDLLAQRPDVRSSWYSLMAADWAVSAGKADRLPTLTLSANAMYSGEPTLVLSNWLANLSAGLIAPLFDGGQRAAEVKRLQAVVEEEVQAYGKIVIIAVGEVQDSLVDEAQQQEYLMRLQDQLHYAKLARAESREGYVNGRGDFLSFIVEHKNVQALEKLLLSEGAELLRYRVALHRALGGNIYEQAPNSKDLTPEVNNKSVAVKDALK